MLTGIVVLRNAQSDLGPSATLLTSLSVETGLGVMPGRCEQLQSAFSELLLFLHVHICLRAHSYSCYKSF